MRRSGIVCGPLVVFVATGILVGALAGDVQARTVTVGVVSDGPVSMAAVTTIMGMIPLPGGAFSAAMAVTIMAGSRRGHGSGPGGLAGALCCNLQGTGARGLDVSRRRRRLL